MSPKVEILPPEPDQAARLLAIAEPIVKRLIVDPIVAAITSKAAAQPKLFMSLGETCDRMGLPAPTVKRLRKDGRLAAIRAGQQWMFLRSSVEEWKP